jgi:MFS family permease
MLHGPGRVSRARLATAWVFFANGAALGSWVPHIPDTKHALALTDSVLGFALLGMAAGSLLGLPLSGALTAHFGSRATTTAAILAVLLATPLPILAPSLTIFTLALALLGIANGGVDVARQLPSKSASAGLSCRAFTGSSVSAVSSALPGPRWR